MLIACSGCVQLTAVVVLDSLRADGALLGHVDGLGLETGALGTHAAAGVHGLLEGIALPAEDVIGVLAVAGVVTRAEVEGLRAIGGPLRLVVELGGIPDNLVHQLRDPDGVRRRARAAQAEEVGGARRRVGDVVLVVIGVEVLAIPAAIVWRWLVSRRTHRVMTGRKCSYVGK